MMIFPPFHRFVIHHPEELTAPKSLALENGGADGRTAAVDDCRPGGRGVDRAADGAAARAGTR